MDCQRLRLSEETMRDGIPPPSSSVTMWRLALLVTSTTSSMVVAVVVAVVAVAFMPVAVALVVGALTLHPSSCDGRSSCLTSWMEMAASAEIAARLAKAEISPPPCPPTLYSATVAQGWPSQQTRIRVATSRVPPSPFTFLRVVTRAALVA
jgi:hypothetical protein|tara:strand:- start:1593 stop:2045 length:453 start_codon:yes stop_codon:yes gene_type:complete